MDLVRRARAGDLDAFDALVEQHAPPLYRLAAAIVTEADAADLVQDTFVTAWKKLPDLRDPDAFPVWLRRICVNACRNHLRAQGRRSVSLEVAGDQLTSGRHADFRDAVHDRELIGAYFGRLSADQRAMVILHYGAGMTIAEAADAAGIRVGTAKSRLNAALAVLRRALGAPDLRARDEVEIA